MGVDRVRVSVVLPTYNEAGHAADLVAAVRDSLRGAGAEAEVLLVDDGSADGTADVVERTFRGDASVRVIRRTERGLAGAVRRGIEEARGDIVGAMDSDWAHDPAHLPLMLRLLDDFDVVVGSRFVRGGGMDEEWRYLCSYLFNVLVRWTLFTRIQDNLSGFFLARREVLDGLDRDRIFRGYGDYFIRLVAAWAERGVPMIEVPVWYRVRPTGHSKTRFLRMFVQYAWTVAETAARRGLRPRWKGPARAPIGRGGTPPRR